MAVPLPLKSYHCLSLRGGTNKFFFSDNDSMHIWQLKLKRSQGEFQTLPPFPPPHLQKDENPSVKNTSRTRVPEGCHEW